MNWTLRFLFWLSIGVVAFTGTIMIYLLAVLRHWELFPALAGAAMVPAVLVAIALRKAVLASVQSAVTETLETITIGEPPAETVEIR